MQDLTTGPIFRHLLNTGGFMLFTMVFQTLYFLADLYWMGRLGKEAVAGVGVAGNLMFITLALTQMLGVGTTTLVAHAAGRRDRDAARRVFNQAQGLSLLAGALFLVVGLALTPAYADAFAADAATAAMVRQFLWWFVPAMALQFAMVALAAALRGIGDFKPGMVVQSSTVALNIALAPVLIFGWGTGHRRSAWPARRSPRSSPSSSASPGCRATSNGPTRSCISAATRCGRDLATWKRLLGIGLPAGVEFGLIAVYMGIVYAVSRPFGAAAQAGFGIGQRVVQAGFMPIVALGFAVAPVAGQNFGARLGDRVRETFTVAATLAVGGMLVLVGLCHVAPGGAHRRLQRRPGGGRGGRRSTCASCRGTSWPAGWSSWPRACSRRWAIRCRRW